MAAILRSYTQSTESMASILESPAQSVGTMLLLLSAYLVCLGTYRLYLHPLSKFPGPKLAALTKWYEFYYDVVVGGQFTFHLQDLHKRYGPIIRINPDEIHINDPAFYEEFYAKQGKLNKYYWMSGYFGNETSIFTTEDHELHKARRAPMQPLFSRSRILQLEGLVREKTVKMLGKIAQYKQSHRPFPINDAFMALSEDVVFEFCFGQCYDVLDVPDFTANMSHTLVALTKIGHVAAHLPFIPKTMLALPEPWLEKVDPVYASLFRMKRDLTQWARDVKEGRNEAANQTKHTTILRAILDSDLPAKEKELKRLQEEAHIVVGAAITTTGWAASVATFHILDNPSILTKLRDELEKAIPDPTTSLEWIKLERLPYLTACIKEGIRLSVGESNRSPRLSDKVITYGGWKIPPRTPTSLSICHVSFDENIFPEPQKFVPERWIDAGYDLDKYFVPFGRGSRSCIGMQLAHAEMYHMVAGVFRNFELELYETDITDVEFQYDFSIPSPKLDTKGVRVKVKTSN